jgi:ethanolamine permease
MFGILAALPFAVWLFLAIEQLPLAAEESVDPKRDMPKGIMLGRFTLIVSAFCVLYLNPSVAGVGSFKLGSSGEPLLDGFRAIYGSELANLLRTGGELPCDHLCIRPADLFGQPCWLLPDLPVGHPRYP